MKKKIISILTVTAVCCSLFAGCGSSSDSSTADEGSTAAEETADASADEETEETAELTAPETDFTLGAVVYNLSDAVPVNVKNMLEAYAEMLNVDLTVVVGNGSDGNLEAVENLVSSGVDGIFMMSAEGIDAYYPVMEEAGVYLVLGSTKVLSDTAKETVADSEYFLGQVSFDDEAIMEMLVDAAVADGATEVGLIAPTNVTPNYLGIRKQAAMDALDAAGVSYVEGTGDSYFDFTGFTSSLLATYPDLEYYISVTTADSAYSSITLAEMNGKVKLYAANRADNAKEAMEDGTLQVYVAGTEHCAAEFLIMYNFFMGNDLREDGQYIDLTSAALYVDSLETQEQFEEYYEDIVVYDADFMLQCDTLDELNRMVESATLENFVSGTYMDGVLDE